MKATIPPMTWTWDAEAMVLRPTNLRLAARVLVDGQAYPLAPYAERSSPSHRHFFAVVKECWESLPEQVEGQFASPDHLRKWALIKAGYYNERSIVCPSDEEAIKVAAFLRPADAFAIIIANDNTVTEYTAKSVSYDEMKPAEFQQAKCRVFEILADMLGVEVGSLPTAEAA